MSCSIHQALYVSLGENIQTIKTELSLPASQSIHWRITDRFDNAYEGDANSTADGKLDIPLSSTPEGFSKVGTYTLQFFNSAGQRLSFSKDGHVYRTVRFSFRKILPAQNTDVIRFPVTTPSQP